MWIPGDSLTNMCAVGSVSSGISLKSQELFFLVFVTRYLDLLTHFVSVYNTLMKLLFLVFSGAIVYVIRFREPFRSTYDKSHDAFLHLKFAVIPCALLALVFNEQFEVMEILWTFSIYLEAVAIIPQLILLQRHGEVENLTSNYVVLLGAYRGCYILNWIYRAATETSYHFIWLMFIAGMVQTALYVDFFYYYAIRCVCMKCCLAGKGVCVDNESNKATATLVL